MRRVLIYDRFDAQVCELSENDVFELTRHEVVNGAHELTITTTQVLEKGYRVLMEDDRGYWYEWCVSGIDEQHANGSRPYGSYYCVWSLQPDLMGTRVSAMPGVQTPVTAAQALDAALGGTSRWTRGTITNTNTGGASMYDTDGWSAMSTLVANWGGEVATSIGVSASGVVSRLVDLYAQQGESTAKRRYDFGADLVSVRRTIADDPLYCRITPRGKGEATEGGGYGRKITIESVNDGKDYLENASMVDLAKLPDGNGGWEYPTLEVENSDCATPADLLTWAQSVLDAYTNPKVTYEVNVVQAAKEGIDLQGVSLGDEVQVVDGKFNDLRLTGRVMEITIDELARTTTSLTIGSVTEGISSRFSDLYDGIKTAEQSVTQLAQSLSTADYIDSLLDRINAEINATGGYAYIVPGNGILTFDVAVADPLNPVEASRVVEIKGGTIRIANTKTAQGQWEWKTVFTSGHVAAELVTAAQLTTGYIGNANGTYWDLDNNLLHLPATTIMDDTTLGDMANQEVSAANLIRNGDFSFGASYWGKPSANDTFTVEDDTSYGHHMKFVQSASGSTDNRMYTNTSTNFTHTAGETYSISFYAKASASNTLVVNAAASTSSANLYLSQAVTTSWKRYTATTTPSANGSLTFWLQNSGTLYLAKVMLVHGDKPMDYSPDQRDVAADIATAGTANTMIRAYGSGVLVCKQGNTVGALVNSNGSFDVVKVTWSDTTPTASTVYSSFGTAAVIGESGKTRVEIVTDAIKAYQVSGVNEYQYLLLGGSNSEASIGYRASGSTVGSQSVSIGFGNKATGWSSIAIGNGVTSSGQASAAIGNNATASGSNSFAVSTNNTASGDYSAAVGGNHNTASGNSSAAFGQYTIAGSSYQFVCGKYNLNNSNDVFEIGWGNGTSTSARSNLFRVTNSATVYAGTAQLTSDRRIKTHLGELSEDDAVEFVRQLKPSKFVKFGRKELGFYAQDVDETSLSEYLVDKSHNYGYEDFMSLSYNGLIAPLTAYAQNLEKRVESLESRLSELEEKIGKE